MKLARNRYKGGMRRGSLASSGCTMTAITSAISVARPKRYPTQMRGNGGNPPGSACCCCDSALDESRLGSVTALALFRQTIWAIDRARLVRDLLRLGYLT